MNMAQPFSLLLMKRNLVLTKRILVLTKRILLAWVLGVALFGCLRVAPGSSADPGQASWQSRDGSGVSDCIAPRPVLKDGACRERDEPSEAPGFQFLAIPVGSRTKNSLTDAWTNPGVFSPTTIARRLGLQSRAPPVFGLA